MKIKEKRGMETEVLVWILIAVAVLVIGVIGYFILFGKGEGALEYLQNLFRLRR